jgi:hypothetical protein
VNLGNLAQPGRPPQIYSQCCLENQCDGWKCDSCGMLSKDCYNIVLLAEFIRFVMWGLRFDL